MKKIADWFREEKDKTKLLLLCLLLVGAVLLSLPKSEKDTRAPSSSEACFDELREYAAFLEEGLCRTVKSTTGDETAQVFVTLEGTYENVYASDASVNEATTGDTTDRKSEKQLVLTGSGTDGKQAVTVKRLTPKVKGAVIVCRGGEEEGTKKKIVLLASTALNVPETKIYVTGGN